MLRKKSNIKRRRRNNRRRQKPISQAALRNAIRFVGSQQKNKESKFQQNQIGFVNNLDTDGDLVSGNGVCYPSQGANQHQRIGDRVVVKSIRFNIQYHYGFTEQDINPGGTAVSQFYPVGALLRVVLFIDKVNSVITSDELIWPAGTPASQIISNGYDPDYIKNITIIHDQVYEMNPTASVNNVPFSFISIYHKFKGGLELAFDEGTTTVTANSIRYFLVTNMDTTASDDAKPDLLLNCRSEFIDP